MSQHCLCFDFEFPWDLKAWQCFHCRVGNAIKRNRDKLGIQKFENSWSLLLTWYIFC